MMRAATNNFQNTLLEVTYEKGVNLKSPATNSVKLYQYIFLENSCKYPLKLLAIPSYDLRLSTYVAYIMNPQIICNLFQYMPIRCFLILGYRIPFYRHSPGDVI